MYEWETVKCQMENLTTTRNIPVPMEFHVIAEKITGSIYNKALHKLKLESKNLETIFRSTLQAIVELINIQIEGSTQSIKYIVLVGGFSQSKILFNSIFDAYNTKVTKIIQSPFAAEAILCGGALLGIDPSLIKARKTKFSYGVEVVKDFEHGDDENRVEVINSRFLCKGIFLPFVKVGQEIAINETIEHKFDVIHPKQSIMEIEIFISPKNNVKYVDDKLISSVGKLEVKLPLYDPSFPNPYVKVMMQFGKIEVLVEAEDHKGTKVHANINFKSNYA